MRVLALIPMKADLLPALRERAMRLANHLEGCMSVHCQTRNETGDGRAYSGHAKARNAMLDEWLKPSHTHVLWIDADVVNYPDDLISRLMGKEGDIVAAIPLIEGTNRFYDVYGFVDTEGRRPNPYPPYFDRKATLASVGTCYLANAAIYHQGARYSPIAGHTEHYSVCRKAERVACAEDIIIYHADLPKWGEPRHT